MRRNVIFTLLVTVVLLAVILGLLVWQKGREKPVFRFLGAENYNNYILDNDVDYKDGQFAWQTKTLFGSKLVLLDDAGKSVTINGISAPFQLLDDGVVFVKNGKLIGREIAESRDITIAGDVSGFVAVEDFVYYRSKESLFVFDIDREVKQLLATSVVCFYVHNEQLHILDAEGGLSRLEADGEWTLLHRIQIPQYPFYVMPQGESVVYLSGNDLIFVDLVNGNVDIVSLGDISQTNHQIHFICDDNQLFLSFQARKTDGSIVTDTEHSLNGVWSVDAVTRTPKKLCDETFDRLYLFGDNGLFGTKEGKLHQISVQTGEIQRIS